MLFLCFWLCSDSTRHAEPGLKQQMKIFFLLFFDQAKHKRTTASVLSPNTWILLEVHLWWVWDFSTGSMLAWYGQALMSLFWSSEDSDSASFWEKTYTIPMEHEKTHYHYSACKYIQVKHLWSYDFNVTSHVFFPCLYLTGPYICSLSKWRYHLWIYHCQRL